MSMSSEYSIKDLELLSGIKAHTLRIWEQRYNILKPERTDTNIRFYTNADLKRILNISILNKNGYKISNIAVLDDDVLILEAEKFLNIHVKDSNKLESLYLCLVELNELKFEDIINKSIIEIGFENTIEKVVFPFIRHLGNLWQLGTITPAQEHFITNLIRQKLIVGIDKLAPEKNPKSKFYIFFLPTNELHEMGLLYTYYLAKAKGHRCLYLGQSVPIEDVGSIVKDTQPDVVVTILTNRMPDMNADGFVELCEKQIQKAQILLSGRLFFDPEEKSSKPDSKRISLFTDFMDFKNHI